MVILKHPDVSVRLIVNVVINAISSAFKLSEYNGGELLFPSRPATKWSLTQIRVHSVIATKNGICKAHQIL